MQKYKFELDDLDLGQVLDGLESRASAWEKTAIYYRRGESDVVVEECRDAEEAQKIAAHYRAIVAKIRMQREAQS